MFITIYKNRLRQAEFLQLMRFIQNLIEESGIESLNELHEEYKAEIDEFENSIKTVVKNPLTAEIHFNDDKRDLTYGCIIKLVDLNSHHSNSTIAQAAKLMQPVINAHGRDAAYLSLKEETAVLSSFITEIETDTHLTQAVSDIVGLQDWINDLKMYNAECERLLQERNLSNLDIRKAAEIKNGVYDAYIRITNHVMAHIHLNSEGNYTSLKDAINQQIKNV